MVTIKRNKKKFNNEIFENFEKKIGLNFPKQFNKFIQEYNGGKPEPNIFELNIEEMLSFSIQYFFGIDLPYDDDLIKQYILYKGRIPKECIPIAYTEGGNIVCISLGSNSYGAIFLWDHNVELLYESGITVQELYPVADSFEEFLDMLKPFNQEDFELEDGQVLEVWVDPDFLKELEEAENQFED